MKTVVCVEPGIIVAGNVLKNGKLSEKGQVDVTQACVIAMMQHISCLEAFQKEGIAGYSWNKTDGEGQYQLILYDTEKFSLVPNEINELLENSAETADQE